MKREYIFKAKSSQNVLETPSILPVKYFYLVGGVSQETANWFESLLFCQEIEGHRFFFG